MTRLAVVVLGIVACGAPAAPAVPANRVVDPAPIAQPSTIRVPGFGDVAVADSALLLMDRGSGDERVHVIAVSRDDRAVKTSWNDRPGIRTELRSAAFELSADERAQIRSWSDELWQLAPAGRRSFVKAPDGTPIYEWAIVVRRGAEIRVIDGGASGGDQPDVLEGVVDFLDMHF